MAQQSISSTNFQEFGNHEANFNVIYVKSEKTESFVDENESNHEQLRNLGEFETHETPEQLRLRKARERKRLFNLKKRMSETAEEKAERRTKAREQKRAIRKIQKEKMMTEQEILAKERERIRIQERRKNESEEKKAERRAKDRERQRAKRAWMKNVELGLMWGNMSQSEESLNAEETLHLQDPQFELLKQIQDRKTKDKERNAMKRMKETEEQKAERRTKDREQHAEMRLWKKRLASQGDEVLMEKVTTMKERDRKRIAEKRKKETKEQREERKEKDRLRHAARRSWMKNIQVGRVWDTLSHSNKRNDLPNSNMDVQIKIKQESLEIKEEELIIGPDPLGQSHIEIKEKIIKQEPPNQFEFVSINSLSYC